MAEPEEKEERQVRKWTNPQGILFLPYLWVFLLILIITLLGKMSVPLFDNINIVLLYLLPVLVAAVRWGRGPSFFASFLSVAAFDFFFVPPVFRFTVGDVRYLFSFAIFLLVALVTGSMAARLRDQAEKARQHEGRTLALYTLGREIAAETDLGQVLRILVKRVAEAIEGSVFLFLRDSDTDTLHEVAAAPPGTTLPGEKERAVAHWVLEHGQQAGKGTPILGGSFEIFFPVRAENRTLAVLAVRLNAETEIVTAEQEQLIEAVANLAAVAIGRLQLSKEAEQAKWLVESEKLHVALLNSISHDLRTPLASITGAATGLMAEGGCYNEETRRVLLQTIKEGAQRLNRFVANLLDMARLESGVLKLNREWCEVQDVLGVALRETRDILQDHPLLLDIPSDLPFVKADFALIEHVVINLLENAAKYSPAESKISVSARQNGEAVLVTVADRGPAISIADRARVFDKFYRLQSSRHVSGTGLGLSICRGIIEVHGGKIWADSSPDYGNRITFSLPATDELLDRQGLTSEVDGAV
jgi:two-component system sensor histidine kinase KdpD